MLIDQKLIHANLLALLTGVFAVIGAVEELAVEQLHRYDSEDELKQNVHDQDVDDVFQ